jgi:2-succinyl-5-enolpyruvyl-6-hydroxy-3-cyclohexene-1-carboxylate synthase
MRNLDSARRLIDAVRGSGADEFCICAGSRNSPLLAILGHAPVRRYSFFEERSAAFFALGRAKLTGKPVAVVTTSGTAVAELLPAAIEAHYSGLPLILVTADRPARFRGTGAPQAIEQEGIFGVYAATSFDGWDGRSPLHVNIEFDEPLIDGDPASVEFAPAPVRRLRPRRIETHGDVTTVLDAAARPLVLLGALRPEARDRVSQFVKSLNAPVYAEPLSGLREEPGLPQITAGERMIARGQFDAVIRIGGIPALRFWRDLEELALPVVHFTDVPFSGLTRGEIHPLDSLPADVEQRERDDAFFSDDREKASALGRILDAEPNSELSMLRSLSRDLRARTRVYLGNSLPIREWDLVADRTPRGLEYEGNRGANGIDGQLSTFLGQCDPDRDNVCVVGDLTALYDLAAPWVLPQLGPRWFRIVVVNNGGGRIFGRVPSLRSLSPEFRESVIENAHQVRFDAWGAMWGLGENLVELRPDPAASARAWARYDELWR